MMSIRLVYGFCLLFSIASSALVGGFVAVPQNKLPTIVQDDPSYALTRTFVDAYFQRRYQVPLGKELAVSYQIVGGVRYRAIYNTSLGISQVTCFTVYWQKTVEIESLAFIHGTSQNQIYSDVLTPIPLNAQNGSFQLANNITFAVVDLTESVSPPTDNTTTLEEQILSNNSNNSDQVPPLNQSAQIVNQTSEEVQAPAPAPLLTSAPAPAPTAAPSEQMSLYQLFRTILQAKASTGNIKYVEDPQESPKVSRSGSNLTKEGEETKS